MAYYPRRKNARKLAARKPRKYARRIYKKKSSLVKTIKRVMHSEIENKIVSYYAVNQLLTLGTTGVNPYYINLSPSPVQSVTSQGRVGNSIRVVKASVNGFVNVLPYNAITNPMPAPIYVRMWLCRRKSTNIPISGQPSVGDFNNFFQSGATTLGFQQNMLDMTLKNNLEYWTILSTKTIQLQNSYYAGATAGTTTILGSAYRVSQPFRFSFAQHLTNCKYNDTATFPQNKELYLVFQPVYGDGSTAPAGSGLAEAHFNVEWQYEDV